MISQALFSSAKDDWETPPGILALVREYAPITLDPCTSEDNPTGAEFHYTKAENGLALNWTQVDLTYCNPPYSRAIRDWTRKGIKESAHVLYLLPARTDTKWFHELYPHCDRICLIKGRLFFGGSKQGAPFPSALFLLNGNGKRFDQVFENVGMILRSK